MPRQPPPPEQFKIGDSVFITDHPDVPENRRGTWAKIIAINDDTTPPLLFIQNVMAVRFSISAEHVRRTL